MVDVDVQLLLLGFVIMCNHGAIYGDSDCVLSCTIVNLHRWSLHVFKMLTIWALALNCSPADAQRCQANLSDGRLRDAAHVLGESSWLSDCKNSIKNHVPRRSVSWCSWLRDRCAFVHDCWILEALFW